MKKPRHQKKALKLFHTLILPLCALSVLLWCSLFVHINVLHVVHFQRFSYHLFQLDDNQVHAIEIESGGDPKIAFVFDVKSVSDVNPLKQYLHLPGVYSTKGKYVLNVHPDIYAKDALDMEHIKSTFPDLLLVQGDSNLWLNVASMISMELQHVQYFVGVPYRVAVPLWSVPDVVTLLTMPIPVIDADELNSETTSNAAIVTRGALLKMMHFPDLSFLTGKSLVEVFSTLGIEHIKAPLIASGRENEDLSLFSLGTGRPYYDTLLKSREKNFNLEFKSHVFGSVCRSKLINSDNFNALNGISNFDMKSTGFSLLNNLLANQTLGRGITTADPSILFIILVHNRAGLENLQHMFSWKNGFYTRDNHGYLLVPDQKLRTYTKSARHLSSVIKSLDVGSNFHVMPSNLLLHGSWGGASLVYKELLSYIHAFQILPSFTHTVLMDARTLVLKSWNEMTRMFRKTGFHMSLQSNPHMSSVDTLRLQSIAFDCDGTLLSSNTTTQHIRHAPQKLWPYWGANRFNVSGFRKASQWKVLSRSLLDEMFIDKKNLLIEYAAFFDNSLVPDEYFLPTFFHHELNHLAKQSPFKTMFVKFHESSGLAFSLNLDTFGGKRLFRNRYVLNHNYLLTRKVTDTNTYRDLVKDMFEIRRSLVSVKFGHAPDDTCMKVISEHGNLGTLHHYTDMGYNIAYNEFHAMFTNISNSTPKPVSSNKIIFVILVGNREELQLLKNFTFTKHNSIFAQNRDYLVVPDSRLIDSSQNLLNELEHDFPNVHLLPRHLMTKGAWGGASLLYKELIGYAYAFSKFSFTHVALMSATMIPFKSSVEMELLLKPEMSYIEVSVKGMNRKDHLERHCRRYYDCLGSVIKFPQLRPATEIPNKAIKKHLESREFCDNKAKANGSLQFEDASRSAFRKGSQWRLVSHSLLERIFLGNKRDSFLKYVHFFDSTLIPDEHFFATFAHHELVEGKDFVNLKLTKVFWAGWKPRKLNVEFLQPRLAEMIQDPRVFFSRKAISPKILIDISNLINSERLRLGI